MASSTANKAAIRKAVRSQITTIPLDRIVSQLTNTTVNHLERKCAKLAASVKTTKWGGLHGCLALFISDEELQPITGNNTSTTESLDKTPLTPDRLTNSTTLINQAKLNAKHKIEQEEYWKQEAVGRVKFNRLVQ